MGSDDIGGTLAVVTATGTAVTVLTEVLKQYVREDQVPPPMISGSIAAVFTAAWVLSKGTALTWADALGVVMIWFSLFQVSIAVYHGAQLSSKRRAGQRRTEVDVTRSGPGRVATTERVVATSSPAAPPFPPIPDLPINDGDSRPESRT
jgi:hypothetical protein